MEVIYYQITIFVTITVAFWLGKFKIEFKHLASAATLLWCFFTIANVSTASLSIVQFGTVIGSFLLNRRWSKNLNSRRNLTTQTETLEIEKSELIRENEELSSQIAQIAKQYNESLQENLERLEESAFHPIVNNEHRECLEKAFSEAQKSVCVTSGWINDRVVSQKLSQNIKASLERGVDTYIVFGYQDRNGESEIKPDARRALERLGRLARYGQHIQKGSLNIAIQGTHEKLLVVDGEYLIVGSNNWLSNNNFINSERSYLINDTKIATEEHERITSLVKASLYPLLAA